MTVHTAPAPLPAITTASRSPIRTFAFGSNASTLRIGMSLNSLTCTLASLERRVISASRLNIAIVLVSPQMG
mgnify:CR=1 FL=1